MEILNKIGSWADKLTHIGVSLIPFWPNISVVGNIMEILGSLNAEGLLGLVGAFVLYHIVKK